MQPEVIASCHITGYQREEISTSLSTPPQEEVVDSDEVTPQYPLLQAAQTQ